MSRCSAVYEVAEASVADGSNRTSPGPTQCWPDCLVNQSDGKPCLRPRFHPVLDQERLEDENRYQEMLEAFYVRDPGQRQLVSIEDFKEVLEEFGFLVTKRELCILLIRLGIEPVDGWGMDYRKFLRGLWEKTGDSPTHYLASSGSDTESCVCLTADELQEGLNAFLNMEYRIARRPSPAESLVQPSDTSSSEGSDNQAEISVRTTHSLSPADEVQDRKESASAICNNENANEGRKETGCGVPPPMKRRRECPAPVCDGGSVSPPAECKTPAAGLSLPPPICTPAISGSTLPPPKCAPAISCSISAPLGCKTPVAGLTLPPQIRTTAISGSMLPSPICTGAICGSMLPPPESTASISHSVSQPLGSCKSPVAGLTIPAPEWPPAICRSMLPPSKCRPALSGLILPPLKTPVAGFTCTHAFCGSILPPLECSPTLSGFTCTPDICGSMLLPPECKPAICGSVLPPVGFTQTVSHSMSPLLGCKTPVAGLTLPPPICTPAIFGSMLPPAKWPSSISGSMSPPPVCPPVTTGSTVSIQSDISPLSTDVLTTSGTTTTVKSDKSPPPARSHLTSFQTTETIVAYDPSVFVKTLMPPSFIKTRKKRHTKALKRGLAQTSIKTSSNIQTQAESKKSEPQASVKRFAKSRSQASTKIFTKAQLTTRRFTKARLQASTKPFTQVQAEEPTNESYSDAVRKDLIQDWPHLRAAFRQADPDGYGSVPFEEAKTILSKALQSLDEMEFMEMLKSFDPKDNQRFEYVPFLDKCLLKVTYNSRGMKPVKHPPGLSMIPVVMPIGLAHGNYIREFIKKVFETWGNLRAAFDAIDQNKDGYLDKDELKRGVRQLGLLSTRSAAFCYLMGYLDVDMTGRVSYEAFTRQCLPIW